MEKVLNLAQIQKKKKLKILKTLKLIIYYKKLNKWKKITKIKLNLYKMNFKNSNKKYMIIFQMYF